MTSVGTPSAQERFNRVSVDLQSAVQLLLEKAKANSVNAELIKANQDLVNRLNEVQGNYAVLQADYSQLNETHTKALDDASAWGENILAQIGALYVMD